MVEVRAAEPAGGHPAADAPTFVQYRHAPPGLLQLAGREQA
jgi:hypothetical protein